MPSILPGGRAHLLKLNPMYPVIESFQQVILYNHTPDIGSLVPLAILSLILLPLSYLLFLRAAPEMVDEL
jgi:lipopolysaccharide transport system permease protein